LASFSPPLNSDADISLSPLDGLDWTRNGRLIIYSGLAGDRLQLFSEPRSGGAPHQLTHDSGNLMHPRGSAGNEQASKGSCGGYND
jgi:hypothetical protein